MSIQSVCQVARIWVDVGSFHMRLFIMFMIFTASVRNIVDVPSYVFVLWTGRALSLLFVGAGWCSGRTVYTVYAHFMIA
jgi:hypothetical protein